MARIFVNYRRVDSDFAADKVAGYLKNEFGEDEVFFDVKNIQSGEEWAKVIYRALRACEIVVVVMRVNWLREIQRRLATPQSDWVRIEIEYALKHGLKIFPLLIDTYMPAAHELPEDIRALASIQDINVRYRYFDRDITVLRDEIAKIIPPRSRPNTNPVPTKNSPAPPAPATLPEGIAIPMPKAGSVPVSTPQPTRQTYPSNPASKPDSYLPPKPPAVNKDASAIQSKPTLPINNQLVLNIFDLLTESETWKEWGLVGVMGMLAIVIPITLISSLATTIGWGGIVLGGLGGILGIIVGFVVYKVILYMVGAIVIGVVLGIIGGAAFGVVQALINSYPTGATAIRYAQDGALLVGSIFTFLGLMSGIGSQMQDTRYSYGDEEEKSLSAGILGVISLIFGIALAVDAWGPGVPLGDVIGHLISRILFWGIFLGVVGGLIGIAAGVIYDKISPKN